MATVAYPTDLLALDLLCIYFIDTSSPVVLLHVVQQESVNPKLFYVIKQQHIFALTE